MTSKEIQYMIVIVSKFIIFVRYSFVIIPETKNLATLLWPVTKSVEQSC
jgi:hypothetical protein